VIIGARAVFVVLSSAVVATLLVILGLQATGDDLGTVWQEIKLPLSVIAVCVAVMAASVVASAVVRVRNRRRRAMVRYQLVLSQADEATFEEVAATFELLVQTAREAMTERLLAGQPWVALESWFLPARRAGETGTAALMLLCQPHRRESAMAALRRAYPDLMLRADPASPDGAPLQFAQPSFVPGHVLRVRKTRGWAHPLGLAGHRYETSNARSTMADIIRQQQQAGRVSCVRWCVLPAADQVDSRAADKLARLARSEPNPARSGDVQQALESAGGAMSYLELQAAIECRQVPGRRGRSRPESFSELQNVCRQMLGPGLSQRGPNHLSERLMVFRQGLYRRRFTRGEPPLLPAPGGATLVSPRELAALMELPSLGSEHALPLQRNTVPHLPIPTEAPRAHMVEPPFPPAAAEDAPHKEAFVADDEEIVDAELVFEDRRR